MFLHETPSEDASSAKNVENLWRVPVQVSCGDSSSIYFMPWNYYFLLGISDLGAQPCWFALNNWWGGGGGDLSCENDVGI